MRRLGSLWLFCRRKPLGAIGGILVLGMIVLALFAPWIAPHSYDDSIRGARMKPPSAQFWMGTDNLSRDIWSRVVYGARVAVTVGFGAVLLGNALATAIGITSGYFGGKYDMAVQRVVDAWQSFPFLVVILSLMAVLGPGMLNVILALGILGAAAASRVIRGATISVLQNAYIEAARAMGAGHIRIMLRHVLPNVAATIIILPTLPLPPPRGPSPASTCWALPCGMSPTPASAAPAAGASASRARQSAHGLHRHPR